MKPLWHAEDVLLAVRGESLHEQTWTAARVCADSRAARPGDLFVAIRSPGLDNDVAQAFAAGAAAAIVQRAPARVPADAPLVFVEDSTAALLDLGHVARQRTKAKIVAVTGSCGKAVCKELLQAALEASGETYASIGPLASPPGVALALANLPAGTRFGIFDLGLKDANDPGSLARAIAPHVTLIANIESSEPEHPERAGALADTAAGLFLGMNPDGVAVLNRDAATFPRLLAAARTQGLRRSLAFGRHAKSDARTLSCSSGENGCDVRMSVLGQALAFRLDACDATIAYYATAALLAAAALGADIFAGAGALAGCRPSVNRAFEALEALGQPAFSRQKQAG